MLLGRVVGQKRWKCESWSRDMWVFFWQERKTTRPLTVEIVADSTKGRCLYLQLLHPRQPFHYPKHTHNPESSTLNCQHLQCPLFNMQSFVSLSTASAVIGLAHYPWCSEGFITRLLSWTANRWTLLVSRQGPTVVISSILLKKAPKQSNTSEGKFRPAPIYESFPHRPALNHCRSS